MVPHAATDVARIEALFGPTVFIHLTRPDRLGQAISRLRAEQSGLWHRNADGSALEQLKPGRDGSGFDIAAIDELIATHSALDEAWERWFDREGICPLRLTYDALATAPSGVLAMVLQSLGLDPSLARKVPVQTAKLADGISDEWRARYKAARGMAGEPPAGH